MSQILSHQRSVPSVAKKLHTIISTTDYNKNEVKKKKTESNQHSFIKTLLAYCYLITQLASLL